jgi:hypothetical protein
MPSRLAPILAPLVLAACATEATYTPPAAGQPAATVRFAATSADHRLLVSTYANAQCGKDAASGVMGTVDGKPLERRVRADRPFVFSVQRLAHSGTAISCSVSMSLAPRRDAQYEVEYGEDPASCYLHVFRVETAGAKRVREPSAEVTPKECRD